MRQTKKKLEDVANNATSWIGSIESLLIHTLIFAVSFSLVLFGIPIDRVLLVLTTVLSLEAIYLAIFIQMSVNQNTLRLNKVEHNIEDIAVDVGNIEHDIDEIQEDVQGIEKEVTEIGDNVEGIQEDVEGIQEDVEGIQGNVEEIAEDVEHIEKDIDELQEDVQGIEKEVIEIGDTVDDISDNDQVKSNMKK